MTVYSHSRLSTFEKCPLQYRYRYIDRIKRDTQGIEAYTGNRAHEILESLYRELGEGRRPTLDELLILYRSSWDAGFTSRIKIVKTENPAAHYRSLGERCIANYYRSHEPFDQETTLGLEERVQVALDGDGRYQIQGYIDRLALAGPGVYEIHDYKTSSSLPSDSALRKDRQLSLYQMAVQSRYPEAREIRLVWHYLAHDRDLVSIRSESEIETHRRGTIRAIDTVEAARDYPPRESALCRWCDYRDICPVQKHLVQAEAAARPQAVGPTGPDPVVRRDDGAGEGAVPVQAPRESAAGASPARGKATRRSTTRLPVAMKQMKLFS